MFEIREKFHKEIKAFLKDLIKVFPDDRNVKIASSTLTISLMDDPDDKVINDFYKALKPCEALIAAKDETMFYNNNIKSDVLIFSELEKYWNLLDSDNKEVVWNYITVLFCLAKNYL